MRLKVPLTGTVTSYDPKAAELDGIGVSGDPHDPVRLINIDLGNVSWKLVAIDLTNDLAEIEVSPGEEIAILKAGGSANNPADWTSRPATAQEQQGFLDNAQAQVSGKTSAQLYAASKDKNLVKTADVISAYQAVKVKVAT